VALEMLERNKVKKRNTKGKDETLRLNQEEEEEEFETVIGDENNDEEKDDGEEEEGACPIQKALTSGSYVGTNFNRFAVLQDTTSKRKQKKGNADNDGNQTGSNGTTPPSVELEPPKRRKRLKRNEIPEHPTPTWWAQTFVKTDITLNIAWDAALCFLVQLVDDHSSGPRTVVVGALVPPAEAAVDKEEETSYVDNQKCYRPLLTTLVREWPGFLSSLVVRLVDTVIRLEEECHSRGDSLAPPDHKHGAMCRLQLVYLSSWVEHLLSRSFLLSTGTDSKQSTRSQLDLLRVRQVPLGGLLDRCATFVASNPPLEPSSAATPASSLLVVSQSSCKRLARVLREILQQKDESVEAAPAPLIDYQEQDLEAVCKQDAATEKPSEFLNSLAANAETKPSGFPSGKLSLDELETLLNIDRSEHMKAPAQGARVEATDKAIQAASDSESNNEPRWVLCDTWEPCAIGTLPGYPLMQ